MAELMTEYIKFLNLKIDENLATILLAAMEVDTNSFNVKTSSKTYLMASYLMNLGANNILKQQLLKEEKNEYIERQKLLETSFTINKNIAVIALDSKIYEASFLAQIAEDLLLFEDIEASFAIGYIDENKTGISARSIGNINVKEVIDKFGGGGHLTEAAAQVDMQAEKVLTKLKEILK
jgi:c-di-AMP phosphodiesterase-like protein